MIHSEKGAVKISGDMLDIFADLGVAIQSTAQACYQATGDVEPILRTIVGITCDALLKSLEEVDADAEQKDKNALDRLFDKAMKDWEKNQSE